MAYEREILNLHFEYDLFHNEEQVVVGLARFAVDRGYGALTSRQKSVIDKLFSYACEGITDPGGHQNECSVVLEGEDLVKALEGVTYNCGIICSDCQQEKEGYEAEWARIQAE